MAAGTATGLFEGVVWNDSFIGTVTDISMGNLDDTVYGWAARAGTRATASCTRPT